MAIRETPHEDVELGELEHDAFLPGQNATKQRVESNSIFTRWFPPRIRDFFENLSRIKLMIITLVAFLLAISWVSFANRPISVSIPSVSLALSQALADELEGTAIPGYVLDYAPLVFLNKEDKFLPSDLAKHISNTHPTLNFTTISNSPDSLTLENLNELNDLGGDQVYLTSTASAFKIPDYFHGRSPDPMTLRTDESTNTVVIVVEKGDGIVDAFYLYFYTFNHGPTVVGHVIGDHVGDWEHNMVRFKDGIPQAVWYSQHEYGAAYAYSAVQKAGKRPIVFSASGSHANYAKAGAHDLHDDNEVIPAGIAYDYASPGALWDPALSAHYHTYSPTTNKFTPVTPSAPVGYLYFSGHWGDQEYGDEVEGQEKFHDLHRWTGGPQGPWFKHLDRKDVCLPSKKRACVIKESL